MDSFSCVLFSVQVFGANVANILLCHWCLARALKAVEKLVLSEGNKMVLVARETSYSQGVYGLVANLGSLVVRTVFQPFEEATFTAYSASGGVVLIAACVGWGSWHRGIELLGPALLGQQALTLLRGVLLCGKGVHAGHSEPVQQAQLLCILVRCVCIIGLVAAAFGPAYSFLLLRLMYGERWSGTDAPAALAAYSAYILVLALNGTLEAFMHAVASGHQLSRINGWLVVFAVVHLTLSVVLVHMGGVVGTAVLLGFILHCFGKMFKEC
jgi:oligosaccharide translocation protein RFT1